MEWNERKLLWGIEFIIALLGTMIEWTERNLVEQSTGGLLRHIQDEAKDAKDELSYLDNS